MSHEGSIDVLLVVRSQRMNAENFTYVGSMLRQSLVQSIGRNGISAASGRWRH